MHVQDPPHPIVTGVQHRANLKPLTAKQIRFEIDMCVGCDRCMLACPIPMSSMITMADLNHATISNTIAPHIAKFTEECVLCGSCVPVCPVDNHRDLLMLSLKQRLGISWNVPVDIGRVQNALPMGWNVPFLLSRLREHPLFSDSRLIPDNYLLHLVIASKMLILNPGDVLLCEGEFGRDIYFILEGYVELSSTGSDGIAIPIAIFRRGEYLGDHALLTGQRQQATARAQSPTLVLMVSEQVMHRLMEIQPAVQHYFEQLSNIRSLETIMKRIALFQGMADADIRWIVQQTQIQRYERGERLFSEEGDGQPVRETLHILLEGFVKVARRTVAGTGRDKTDERIIAYRQHEDYFAGGLDMLGDHQSVTVTAITRTRVAEIPRQAMIAIFNRYPEVAQRFNERLRQYREDVSAAHTGVFEAVSLPGMIRGNRYNPLSDAEARIGLHSLVDEGVIEGTDVLVIDLDRCVHCGECEEACARRHGHSRMNRKGMVVGNLTIATACRQCQDPVCMLCSRAGIARMPSGEVYITENCIGCGICAERCPYDNISIVTLSDKKSGPGRSEGEGNLTWQKFSAFFKNGMGKEFGRYSPDKWLPIAQKSSLARPLDMQQPLDAYGGMLKKLAIKCDLCAGYDNQACVQACPTGAAFRTQPVHFFGSTEEILRRRAR